MRQNVQFGLKNAENDVFVVVVLATTALKDTQLLFVIAFVYKKETGSKHLFHLSLFFIITSLITVKDCFRVSLIT